MSDRPLAHRQRRLNALARFRRRLDRAAPWPNRDKTSTRWPFFSVNQLHACSIAVKMRPLHGSGGLRTLRGKASARAAPLRACQYALRPPLLSEFEVVGAAG